jgi:hypothetical protein
MRSYSRTLLALTLALAPACAGSDGAGPAPVPGTGGSAPVATGGTVSTPPTGGSGPTSTGGSTGGTVTETADAAATPADTGAAPADDGGAPPATGSGVFAGMTRLDDGMTLNGWEGDAKLWSAKDGTLQGSGTTGGVLLVTKADYGDFRIIFQTRMTMNTGKGHLGTCFWGKRTTPAGGYGGCKLLIPPGGGSWDYGGGGGLPGVSHPQMGMFDVTQFHQVEILCKLATGTCRMATDGVEVEDYTEPKPARLLKGPIGMQIHAGTSTVQYKEVWIDPAPTDDVLRTKKP